MSEGVDMTQTVNPGTDNPDSGHQTQAKPASKANAPALAPPPVAKLQRAIKAELLPPPPGVVSKRDRPKPAAAPLANEASPQPAAAPLASEASPQPATQSSIEQGQIPGLQDEQDQSNTPGALHQDSALAGEDDLAQTHPEPVNSAVAAHQDQVSAEPTARIAQDTGTRTAAFQSALVPEVEKRSKGRGMWLAIACILLLAGLTWWQLG